MNEQQDAPDELMHSRLKQAAQTFDGLTRTRKVPMAHRAIFIELERAAKLETPGGFDEVHPEVRNSPEVEAALKSVADCSSASRVAIFAMHFIAISTLHHVTKMLLVVIALLILILWRVW